MQCHLCNQTIKECHPALHHLKIDETHEVDICQGCIDKFVQWQGSIIAKLFPTSALKKRYGEKRQEKTGKGKMRS